MGYTMWSLPARLISIGKALRWEAPTVINRDCPIKVGKKDDLGLSLQVWEADGTHVGCTIQMNVELKNCP